MSELAIARFQFGGTAVKEYNLESDKSARRVVKAKRMAVSYRPTLPVDLLSHYDKWGRVEGKIRTFEQENDLVCEETARAAEEIVGLLQPYESIPDVSVGPCGEIDFDWVGSKDWSLTISVCPNREVAFAGIFDIKGSQVHNEGYQLPNEVIAYLEAFDKAKNTNE